MNHLRIKLSILMAITFFCSIAVAQPGYYAHPELKWYTIETDHFTAFYHEGTERTAKTCLKIAEEIYTPVTDIYSYEPDGKIHFLIKDTDDYSNGGAYYYDNKILIWASALDWDLRGDHNWLRNVVTHEFTHMIQLGASRKISRQIPGVYLQWLNYEEEKRPDVLYGFPNVLMSYPVAMTVVPHWFAEGTAQNQAPGFGYDSWDSHRDMLLRSRVMSGELHTLDEMGHFGYNSIGNESVYNQGFSLVSFIRRSYGDEALRKISEGMKTFSNYSFDKAVRKSLGIGSYELYEAWRDSITVYYHESIKVISENLAAGKKHPTPDSYGNFYPSYLNDEEVIYLSNKGRDYMSLTSLYRQNLETGEVTHVKSDVRSRPIVSSDGKLLVYSAKRKPYKRSMYDDLYLLNLDTEKEYRLTKGARATSPVLSPDGSTIVFVINGGGTRNLAIAEMPVLGKKKEALIESWKFLTDYHWGEQVQNPVFSPDGKTIAFEFFNEGARDIYLYDLASHKTEPLKTAVYDERNPSYSPDGKYLLYSCDKTGIFNLYRIHLASGEEELLSNVLGSAFMGRYSADGEIAYIGYCNNEFQIFTLDNVQPVEEDLAEYRTNYIENIPLAAYDDSRLPAYQPEKYKPAFGKLFFLPRLAVDVQSFKPGFYIYSQDFMEWFSIFGGFSFNGLTEEPKFFQGLSQLNPKYIGDYDLFGMIEYNNIIPSIFLEGYNISRRTHQEFADEQHIIGETYAPDGTLIPVFDQYAIDYRFNLGEFDAGFRYKLNGANTFELRGIVSRYGAKLKFDDGVEFTYSYFKGKSVGFQWEGDYRPPQIEGNINPNQGRHFIAQFAREFNSFIDSFKVDAGLLKEVYAPYDYNRFSIQWEEYKKSPLNKDHSITFRLNAAGLDRDNVDDFFYLYAGGLPGMKGYSFYSLGGTKKFISTLTYRIPLLKQYNKRFWVEYLHSVYLGIFADYGNAWTGDIDFSDFKRDLGINLRTQFTSFYAFPTAVTLEAAYGFDTFTVVEPDFEAKYGNEWRYYMTILFSFDLFLGDSPRWGL